MSSLYGFFIRVLYTGSLSGFSLCADLMRWLIAAPSLFERCRNFVLSFFLPFLRAYSQSVFPNHLLSSSRAVSFQGSAFGWRAVVSQRVNVKKRRPLTNAIYSPILEKSRAPLTLHPNCSVSLIGQCFKCCNSRQRLPLNKFQKRAAAR